MFSARAMSYLEVYRLSRAELRDLAKPFPIGWRKIRWEAFRLALIRTITASRIQIEKAERAARRRTSKGEAGKHAAEVITDMTDGDDHGSASGGGGGRPGSLCRRDSWSSFMETSTETPEHILRQQQQQSLRMAKRRPSQESLGNGGDHHGGKNGAAHTAAAVIDQGMKSTPDQLRRARTCGNMNSGGVPGQESTPDPVELVKAGGVGAAALVDEDNPLNLDAEVEEVTTKELQTNLEGVSTEVTKLGMQVGGIEGQLKAMMAAFEGLSKQLAGEHTPVQSLGNAGVQKASMPVPPPAEEKWMPVPTVSGGLF